MSVRPDGENDGRGLPDDFIPASELPPESILREIEAKHGRRRKHWYSWPPPHRFGRVVRDAFAHGGTVHFTDPIAPAVIWRGVTYSHADHDTGRVVLLNDLFPGDLVFLMEDMDGAL